MSGPRRVILSQDQEGQRLDRVLAAIFPEHSRSALARLIEEGQVCLDGTGERRSSHKVRAGQVVEVTFPEPAASTARAEDIPLTLLHEDADIAVLNKPAGIVVHPAAGHDQGTLVNALLFHLTDLSGVGGERRPGIVHRLDKETSGVMVIAKNDSSHRLLTTSWNTERVRKEYLALVYGTPRQERGTIEAPIGRDPRERKRMAVVPGGRKAITEYAVQERLPHSSLLRCTLRSGRTHQIRVHLKHRGHPIVGDPIYSGPQWRGIPDKRIQRLLSSMPRQALHAWRLTLPHPTSGQTLSFEAPLPPDFAALLEGLRNLQ